MSRREDWHCPKCNVMIFGSKDQCRKCGTTRFGTSSRVGDWWCSRCNCLIFATKDACKRCGTKREETLPAMPAYSPAVPFTLAPMAPVATSKEVSIQFGKRMRKSYSVTILTPNVPFKNERGPHVETPEEGLEGKTFQLDMDSRRVKWTEKLNGLDMGAVRYKIIGLEGAHITLYYGPLGETSSY